MDNLMRGGLILSLFSPKAQRDKVTVQSHMGQGSLWADSKCRASVFKAIPSVWQSYTELKGYGLP